MELMKKHGVYVVSDEIWSDIILAGNKHVPTQSVSEDARQRTVALYAPSKTFNLAGLVGSYHVIYNGWLRERVEKESSLAHYNEMNVLSMHALIGAYGEEGQEWLGELLQVLTAERRTGLRIHRAALRGRQRVPPAGGRTCSFIDCTRWCAAHGVDIGALIKRGWDVGVAWQDGRAFNGPCHIRMTWRCRASACRRPSSGWTNTFSTHDKWKRRGFCPAFFACRRRRSLLRQRGSRSAAR